MKQFFAFLTFLLAFSAALQSQVAIGEWRSHLPTNQFEWVGELENAFLVANPHGVFKLDKRDLSITGLNKITGLAGNSISCFSCSMELGACVIGYTDGNLDIIRDDNVIENQRAIINATILGDKQVNGAEFIDDKVYLSTGLGIVVMEVSSTNILFDVPLIIEDEQIQFYELEIFNDSLFASTSNGIMAVPFNKLRDFNAPWKSFSAPAQPNDFRNFFSVDNTLYAVAKSLTFSSDTLLVKRGDAFVISDKLEEVGINSVQLKGDSLLITQSTSVVLYDRDFEIQSTIFAFNDVGGMLPKSSMFSSKDQVLVADRVWGGVLTSFQDQWNSSFISASSPNSADVRNVTIIDETVYAFSDGTEFTYNQPLLHVLEDNEWESYDMLLDGVADMRNINGIVDTEEGLFFSMNATGVGRASDLKTQELYTPANSNVQDAEPTLEYDYFGITGMVKDEDENLWMLNNIVTKPLVLRSADGSWHSFDIGFNKPKTNQLIQLENGFLVGIITDNGILVYDYNDTPEDSSDDRYINLNSNPQQGAFPSSQVTAIAEDQDGELWIGTDQGVAVIYSPETIFDDNFEGAQQIIVNQDGYNGYLLETELVDAIAVDGADRKWLGTSTSGVFLVSADGTRQLQHFTSDNSPLLSDKIVDLEIHPSTGELFISTQSGLISYRTDATESRSDLENLLIFPNPVRPEYSGQISITNLFDETAVRITNTAGRLVHETTSLGGTATWDGSNLDGERVASGVYLVFAVKPDGSQGKVGKILFIN